MTVLAQEQINQDLDPNLQQQDRKESRKLPKLDFENVICLLDLKPEGSGCKLLAALTQNAKQSIIPFLSLSKRELKKLRVTEADNNTLIFND